MRKKRWVLLILGFLLIAAAAGYSKYRELYPYGKTHRCLKVLSTSLAAYANDHNGNYPHSNDPKVFALSKLVPDYITLDQIVGKAGDLKEAQTFFDTHGHITHEHSSWHYVDGLHERDRGVAQIWDKIPLAHDGRIAETREVLTTNGSVDTIPNAKWSAFLERETKKLQAMRKSEAQHSDPQE